MGKSQLIHNNEFHLINKAEIRKATGKLVESLNLAAGSTDGFDIYKDKLASDYLRLQTTSTPS